MRTLINIKRKDKGFTLVEVLVSIVLFSIGLLGIAFQFSQEITARVNNEVHSSVMQISLQAVEPLNYALLTSELDFQNTLLALNASTTPTFVTNNSDLENFSLSIDRAVDRTNQDLLTVAPGLWQSPYSVVLIATYNGRNGNVLNFSTTHVFAPL